MIISYRDGEGVPEGFYTSSQLIDVTDKEDHIDVLLEGLNKYCMYGGLLTSGDHQQHYKRGIFLYVTEKPLLHTSGIIASQWNDPMCDKDNIRPLTIKACEHSNDDTENGCIYTIENRKSVGKPLYNFKEFKAHCDSMRVPLLDETLIHKYEQKTADIAPEAVTTAKTRNFSEVERSQIYFHNQNNLAMNNPVMKEYIELIDKVLKEYPVFIERRKNLAGDRAIQPSPSKNEIDAWLLEFSKVIRTNEVIKKVLIAEYNLPQR